MGTTIKHRCVAPLYSKTIITETKDKVTKLLEENEKHDTLIASIKRILQTKNIILDENKGQIIFNNYSFITTSPFIQSTGNGDIHANNNVFDLNITKPKK
jgi:hypothetical protein